MAEDKDMSAEKPIPESEFKTTKPAEAGGILNGTVVPKIDFEKPKPFEYGTDTGLSFQRMLEIDEQKEHFGEYSNYPKTMPKIDIIEDVAVNGRMIDRMAHTPVPEGGTQLEHLGDHSPYPLPTKTGFKRRAVNWINRLRGQEIMPSGIEAANMLAKRYDKAVTEKDKATQAKLVSELDGTFARFSDPVYVKAENKKRR